MSARTTVSLLAMLVLTTGARAEFSDDQYVSSPRILSQLIAAAEAHGQPFRSETRDEDGHRHAYYLREARYVGSCDARFGRVHVASFFFVRSGWKGGGATPPSQGQSFVAFFDASPRLRAYWRVDEPTEGSRLRFDGTRLLLDEQPIFDFAREQGAGEILVDGKTQPAPVWRR